MAQGSMDSDRLSSAGISTHSSGTAGTLGGSVVGVRVGDQNHKRNDEEDYNLGPLPPMWEKAFTPSGEAYFIDHNTGTSHWLDPRLARVRKHSLGECGEDELPYGWERVTDERYGSYYVDHINRRTQYENPVLQARRLRAEKLASENGTNGQTNGSGPPGELRGERFTITLTKGAQGLGFTLIGAEGIPEMEGYLQIRSIVPNSPAWIDGGLRPGDVLVGVGSCGTRGLPHAQVAMIFQSIAHGTDVTLHLVRGYPLTFDSEDPNTRVLSTLAVDAATPAPSDASAMQQLTRALRTRFNLESPHKSGARDESDASPVRAASPLRLTRSFDDDLATRTDRATDTAKDHRNNNGMSEPGRELVLTLRRGNAGFGFTIADSVHGQKVKKVLDRSRCAGLREGDLLLQIGETDVRHAPHQHVVQALKECPAMHETTLRVWRRNNTSARAPRSRSATRVQTTTSNNNITANRSKTPTAEQLRSPSIHSQDNLRHDNNNSAVEATYAVPELKSERQSLIDRRRSSTPGGRLTLPVVAPWTQDNPQWQEPHNQWQDNHPRDNNWQEPTRPNWQEPQPENWQEQTRPDNWQDQTRQENNWQEPTRQENWQETARSHENWQEQPSNWQDQRPNESQWREQWIDNSNIRNWAENQKWNGNGKNWEQKWEPNGNGWEGNGSRWDGNGNWGEVPTPTVNVDMSSAYWRGNASVADSSDNGGFPEDGMLHSPTTAAISGLARPPSAGRHRPLSPSNSGRLRSHSPSTASATDRLLTTSPSRLQTQSPSNNSSNGRVKGSPLRVRESSPSGGVHSPISRRTPSCYEGETMANRPLYLHNNYPQVSVGGAGGGVGGVGGVAGGVSGVSGDPLADVVVRLGRGAAGFGFRIVGGTEDGSRVAVGYVVPGGPAEGLLRPGDLLTSVDGIPLTGATHARAVAYVCQAASRGHVTLGVRHNRADIQPLGLPAMGASHQHQPLLTTDPSMNGSQPYNILHPAPVYPPQGHMPIYGASYDNNTVPYPGVPYDVTLTRNEGEGFGFVVISSTNKATSTIGQLIPHSPAARCGLLHVGDTLVAINHVSVSSLPHPDVVALIKSSTNRVTLTVLPTHNN